MVEVSYTVVDPWAVVVHLQYTPLTLPAVVGTRRFEPLTAAAEKIIAALRIDLCYFFSRNIVVPSDTFQPQEAKTFVCSKTRQYF